MEGTNTFSKKIKLKTLVLCMSALTLIGCKGITQVDDSKNVRRDSQQFAGTNQALIYRDSPYIIAGSRNFNSINIKDALEAELITTNNYLENACTFEQAISLTNTFSDTTDSSCLLVLNDRSSTTQAIQSVNQSWNFPVYSDQFYQVNLFYHINQIKSRFLDSMKFAHKQVHFDSNMTIPPATKYNFLDTGSYWLTEGGATKTLKAYSKCQLPSINAFFSPAEDTLCFGYNDTFTNFYMTQDPSVIYHEFAHALVKVMMNQRNITSGTDPNTLNPYYAAHPFQSDLGSIFYDEAGAINEGIADYFSYYMNQRQRIGEWGLGAAYAEAFGQSTTGNYRPMRENDAVHTADISEESGKRLSYPQFLHYDPNDSIQNVEGVHNAGMIVSHYQHPHRI
jgi:hypothetical protein